ncbi:hypothetical protein JGS22_010325 [Streptomyces sp. P38-E01]|uniref:Outer membrane channel protein CpnT-like N-terminal domain-containing protein n=1 Tax=Streptomyces tardus TaxID=2780544 RepID=A0A949N4J7_9ACTN|nr:hypothetical protein [Streptomyces tardus]MBU7597994.1 hypothetical protein [Streptomyces tardus]
MTAEWRNEGDALTRINYTPDSPGSVLDEIVRDVLKQFNVDELLEKVSGDNEKLLAVAQKWRDEATALRGVVEDLQAERKTLQRSWTGPASTAFGVAANGFELALLGEADDMDTTAELLELAALECGEAERLMLDLVVELVQSIAVTAATSAILSLVTFGASAAIGAVISGANIAYRVARGVRITAQLAERLARLSRRMQARRKLEGLKGKFDKLDEIKKKKEVDRTTGEEQFLQKYKEMQKEVKKGVGKTVKRGLDVKPVGPIKEALLGDEDAAVSEVRDSYERRPEQQTFADRLENPTPVQKRSVEEAFG